MGTKVRKPGGPILRMAWAWAAISAMAAVQAESALGQCYYSITALIEAPGCAPPFDTSSVSPRAINDHGVVVGEFRPCVLGDPHPFIWSEETGFVAIPLPPGVSDATFADINNNGEIVGWMNQFSSGKRALHYKDGVWTELPMLPDFPQASAHAINDHGDIVGEAFDSFSFEPFRGLLWRDGMVMELVLPIGPQSSVADINNSSQMTGWMGTSRFNSATAFVAGDECTITIPHIPNSTSGMAISINEHGSVAGASLLFTKNGPVGRRSWLFENGEITDLGTLPSVNYTTVVEDINDANQIVGIARNPPPDNSSAPFLWQNGTIHDLRLLIEPPEDKKFFQSAVSTNNGGQIIGHAGPFGVVIKPINRPLGDVNIDCVVDEYDLITVLDDWGPGKQDHLADIVTSATFAPPGDGRVDAADLAVVLGNSSPRL